MPKKERPAGSGIRRLKEEQRKLWRINLALALCVFLMLAVWWIGMEFGAFPPADARTELLMEQADLTAILVFGIDLFRGFSKARDKKMFLRRNWLEIIVLLPVGTAFRAFRAFEELRIFGMAEKSLGAVELPVLVPGIVTHAKGIGKVALKLHGWLSNGKVMAEVSETVSGILKGFPI
ncbi:MAG: hypothetical protein WCT52_01745 [Candidatus Micrarchaeia archaeon]